MYLETHYIHKHFVVMAEITMTTDCKKFSNFVSDKAVSPLRCYNATSATSQSNSAIKATRIHFFFENIQSFLFPKNSIIGSENMNVDNFIKELIINKNGIDIWYSLYYCTVTAHKVKLKLYAV